MTHLQDKKLKRIALVSVLTMLVITLAGCTTKREQQEELKNEGIELMNQGQYDDAVDKFNEALQLAQGSVSDREIDICYYKGTAQTSAGDFIGAEKTYEALIDYDEDNPDPLFLLGSVKLKNGEYESCLEDYHAAVDLDEDNYDMYIAIYENLMAANHEKDAEEFLNIALERSGESEEDYVARGKIYVIMKRYDAAEVAFKKANDKGSEDANIYLVQMYLEKGDTDKCDSILEGYMSEDSLSPVACNAIAQMELMRGNGEDALHYVEMGLSAIAPSNKKDLLKSQVASYEYMGDFDKALELATQYLEEYPGDGDMRRELTFIQSRV